MDIYQFESFRDYLTAKITENQAQYGYKAKLADAARCQRPYLSQVLAGKAHLMPEHALQLSRFWGLGSRETQYLMHLVNKDRAGTKELKAFYLNALKAIKEEAETLSTRFQVKDMPTDHQSIYYSDWLFSAIHILVTVPQYQDKRAIAERLFVPEALVQRVLEKLAKMDLVVQDRGRWRATKAVLHISKESLFNSLNHQNWRQRAILDSRLGNSDGIHYTAVYSLSKEDVQRLRNLVLELIDKTRVIVAPSKEEEVICLNCDLFTY